MSGSDNIQNNKIYESEAIPELIVSKWFNTNDSLSLKSLRGKVVAVHAFQMLCPGCVLHGIPQAKKLFETFSQEHVAVLGLHTVFEHHEAMAEKSLEAFLYEFRVSFPVGIDTPSIGSAIPQTMELFQMRGTPTWLIFDREGKLRKHIFGQYDDMALGSFISQLAMETVDKPVNLMKKSHYEK